MEERIQKLISARGLASRRRAEDWIAAGRVTVNGRRATLGERADPERDRVEVDGIPLPQAVPHTYLMLNKPRGYVSTLSDERGRPTAASLVASCGVRVWPVGRLDMDSEGLLLFTDDGALTHRLLHPSRQVEKEYLVRVRGSLEAALPILTGPMTLDGELLAPARVQVLHQWGDTGGLSVTITQGRNRQIRRMCAAAGLAVLRLRRIREGELRLDPGLKPGAWRHLTGQEVLLLQSSS